MKKILGLMMFCMIAGAGTPAMAQDTTAVNTPSKSDSMTVAFEVVFPQECILNASQRATVKMKIETALARLQASGQKNVTPFIIEPTLHIISKSTTEGGIVPVTLAQGELVLLAKNRNDGQTYNEVTLPLRAKLQDPNGDGKRELIDAINPKDRLIVRFVRNSQQRIVRQYAQSAVEVPQAP